MKRIAAYTAAILGFSGVVGTALLLVYPPAVVIAPAVAWTLTTGFVTLMTGLGIMSLCNANDSKNNDLGFAGAITTLAGLGTMLAVNLSTDKPAPGPAEPAPLRENFSVSVPGAAASAAKPPAVVLPARNTHVRPLV